MPRHVANALARLAVLGSLWLALGAASPAPAPTPQNAVDAVIAAFARVPVVAYGGSHDVEDTRFAVSVVRDPRFGRTVRNVMVECANALYQPMLDRYIAGEDVPLAQLQLVWRNTTQVYGPCDDPDHKELLDAVRDVNRGLPADRRVRVLAADPPIDWDKVHTYAEFMRFSRRDEHMASVIETQVFAKHQNAFVVLGGFHVFRRHSELVPGLLTVTERLEQTHPRSTYVFMSNATAPAALDGRFVAWSVPSAAVLRGTWLGTTDANEFDSDTRIRGKPVKPWTGLVIQDLADAYVYNGPASARHEDAQPPESDKAYIAELERRWALIRRPRPVPASSGTPATAPSTPPRER